MSDDDLHKITIMYKILQWLGLKPKKRYWLITVDLFRNQTYRGAYEVHAETDGEYPNGSVIRFNALSTYQNQGIECNKAVIQYPIVEVSKEDFENHLKIDPELAKLKSAHDLSEAKKSEERKSSRTNRVGKRNQPIRKAGGNRKRAKAQRENIEARKAEQQKDSKE